MIVLRKFALLRQLAAQQSTGQREADNDRDTFFLRFGKQHVNRFLAEDIENNLQRDETRLLKAEQGFVHGFDAGAEVANLALALQLAQKLEHFAAPHDFHRNAMQLREVERRHAQSLQRGLGRGAHVGFGVFVGVKTAGAAEFGGDENFGFAFLEEFSNQRFAAAIAVDVRGVEKIRAGIDRRREDIEGGFVFDISPIRAAQLPATKTHFRNENTSLTESA